MMGFIRNPFGEAWTESRRESFRFGSGPDGFKCIEGATTVECGYEELPDLIAALIDLRDNDERYAEWLPAPEAGLEGWSPKPGDHYRVERPAKVVKPMTHADEVGGLLDDAYAQVGRVA